MQASLLGLFFPLTIWAAPWWKRYIVGKDDLTNTNCTVILPDGTTCQVRGALARASPSIRACANIGTRMHMPGGWAHPPTHPRTHPHMQTHTNTRVSTHTHKCKSKHTHTSKCIPTRLHTRMRGVLSLHEALPPRNTPPQQPLSHGRVSIWHGLGHTHRPWPFWRLDWPLFPHALGVDACCHLPALTLLSLPASACSRHLSWLAATCLGLLPPACLNLAVFVCLGLLSPPALARCHLLALTSLSFPASACCCRLPRHSATCLRQPRFLCLPRLALVACLGSLPPAPTQSP